MEPFTLLVIGLAAIVQGALSFGGAAVTMPLLASSGLGTAIVLTRLLAITANAQQAVVSRTTEIEEAFGARFIAAAAVFGVLGLLLVSRLPVEAFTILVVLSVWGSLLARHRRGVAPVLPGRLRAQARLGALSGLLVGTVGVNGPVLVSYLLHRGCSPAQIRRILAVPNLLESLLVGVVGLLLLPDTPSTALLVSTVPVAVGGYAIGHALHQRVVAHARFVLVTEIALALVAALALARVLV